MYISGKNHHKRFTIILQKEHPASPKILLG